MVFPWTLLRGANICFVINIRAEPWDIPLIDLLDPPALRWARDPVAWATQRMNQELWSAQKEIFHSVRDNSLTAVQSCHEVGKSWTAAHIVGWWIDTHPPGEAFAVTTAPTDKQVKAILWREINRLHESENLLGRTNLSEWYVGKELVAFGRKPSDYSPTAFQGLHAKFMLLVLDEAGGIPKTMWDAGSSLVANEYSRTLAIGNPDDPLSEFADKCKEGSGWNVIHIGYDRTPNFTGEEVSEELKSRLIHPNWVAQKREEWGEDSPLFKSKCKGEFPDSNPDGFIQLSWLNACRNSELPETAPIEAGIDIGAGGDKTVIRERRGMRAGRVESFIDSDPMNTIGRLAAKLKEWGIVRAKVDSIGVGWSVAGRLRELSSRHNPRGERTHDAEIVFVNFAESSIDTDRFVNLRAEVWWTIGREYSRLKKWDLTNVNDDVFAELTSPSYEIMDSKGKIKIQAKEELRKKLKRSPDDADALLLAFYGDGWQATLPSRANRETSLIGAVR